MLITKLNKPMIMILNTIIIDVSFGGEQVPQWLFHQHHLIMKMCVHILPGLFQIAYLYCTHELFYCQTSNHSLFNV